MRCSRCGIDLSEETLKARAARGNFDDRCSDCRVGRAMEIKYNGEVCRPWRGEVDDELNPIDSKLRPYLPGHRTCGHRDCVSKDHIIPLPQDLEMERNDISYRTKRLSVLQDYMRELA